MPAGRTGSQFDPVLAHLGMTIGARGLDDIGVGLGELGQRRPARTVPREQRPGLIPDVAVWVEKPRLDLGRGEVGRQVVPDPAVLGPGLEQFKHPFGGAVLLDGLAQRLVAVGDHAGSRIAELLGHVELGKVPRQ